MSTDHPLESLMESLALEASCSVMAEKLGLQPVQGSFECPLCRHRSNGRHRSVIVIESGRFRCSNTQCGASGDVLDLVSASMGCSRDAAIDIVLRAQAGEVVVLGEFDASADNAAPLRPDHSSTLDNQGIETGQIDRDH